jgi:hypothetical protein
MVLLALPLLRCQGGFIAALPADACVNPTKNSLPAPCLQEEFLENLHKAAAALQRTLPPVIEFIAGKRISEL